MPDPLGRGAVNEGTWLPACGAPVFFVVPTEVKRPTPRAAAATRPTNRNTLRGLRGGAAAVGPVVGGPAVGGAAAVSVMRRPT